MGTLKGQNFRICIFDSTAEKYKVIGMATGCTVTLTNNTDDASHKDIVGAAPMPTVTSKSWQVSCDSLNVADAAAMLTAIKSMQPMTLMWDETSTTDNQTRAKATFARKGSAYLNDVTFNFNDRENSTKSLQFQGSGPLQTVAASEATEVIPLGILHQGSVRSPVPGQRQHGSTFDGYCSRQEPQSACQPDLGRRNDQGHRWRLADSGADGTLLRHLYRRTDAQWRDHHVAGRCQVAC